MNFKFCEIISVYQKMDDINSYILEMNIKQDTGYTPERLDIKINKSNLSQELKELIDGKRERIYAANGMTDIDIFKDKVSNKYCIEWSPCETKYNCFYFKEDNFINKFVKVLNEK